MSMTPFLSLPPAIGAVILAGGQATRMRGDGGGGDKGRRQIGGTEILLRILATLRLQTSHIALSANGDAARFADLALPILADDPGAAGPLAGLLAGLRWAEAQNLPWLLSVPTDTPFLPPDLMLRLGNGVATGADAAIAASGGHKHPVIGLWRTSLRPALEDFLLTQGQRKAGLWAAQCGAQAVEWPDDPRDPFFNVNSPADQVQAETLLPLTPHYAGAVLLPYKHSAHALLADFAAAHAQNLPIAGLLQQGSKAAGNKVTDILLTDFETGQNFSIMLDQACEGSCAVNPSAVAEASAVLRRAMATGKAPILINKFGPLEAEGNGLAAEMLAIMAEQIPLLTTLSLNRLDAWLNFTGGYCELLPATAEALRGWWGRQGRPGALPLDPAGAVMRGTPSA